MKKFTAILLCIAMLVSVFSVMGSATAKTTVDKENQKIIVEHDNENVDGTEADYPIIFVTGIGQSYSYFYEDADDVADYYERYQKYLDGELGENETETDGATTRWNLFCNDFSFAFKDITLYPALLAVVGGLLLSFTGINCIPKWAVKKVITTLFKYNIVDENGELPDNVITPRAQTCVANMTVEQKDNFYRSTPCQDIIGDIGEQMIYCFNYSAFSFVYDNAKDLDTFINEVVLPEHPGYDKVVLVPMSMGASVVSAYLQEYGTKKDATTGEEYTQVARVVSIVGAWDGSDVFADLIELSYAEDAPQKLYDGIVADLIGGDGGYAVNLVLRLFPKATLRSIIDEILGSLVDDFVCKTPSLLALIPHDRYQAIRENVLTKDDDLAYIVEMTDKYYECQDGLKARLQGMNDKFGTEFYYIAGYGLEFGGSDGGDYGFFKFLNTTTTTNSDEIIQISSTATGATILKSALSSTQLTGEEAIQQSGYVSPDGSVDLSTCIFPDNCWLFYQQKHELENNNTALKLALELACNGKTEEAMKFPRFNGSRFLKKVKRDYLPDLARWVCEKAGIEYSDEFDLRDYLETNNGITFMTGEQVDAVLAVYNMMDSIENKREADDKIIDNLINTMADLGVGSYSHVSEDSGDEDSSFMKKVNDGVSKIFGYKGFIDLINPFYYIANK